MTTGDYKRRLRAILSADVEGYSRLMGDDEDYTVRTLTAYRQIMSSLIEKYHGRVVDSPGDNLLAEFESVRDAVQSAVEIQKNLQTQNSELPENREMRFRIGINLGDVITEGKRIYGDGVNVAARIESLAEAGGICLSRSAYDQVIGKIDVEYNYLGEHEVKNIKKPIRVYKVLMDSIQVHFIRDGRSKDPPSVKTDTAFLSEKPSIVVLPFVNMSNDPDQEYFSDGMTEELINVLAKLENLKVISRTSSFFFKGKDVDLRTIGGKLGVENVLEGSVRKAGNKLRITAQLIKVNDDTHLWSESYDRELEDTFTIQDDIVKAVTTALSITLGVGEFDRPGTTRNVDAYDLYLRAMANAYKYTPDSILEAIDQFKQALDIDPRFGLGWIDLARTYLAGIDLLSQGQTVDYEVKFDEALERAREVAPNMPRLLMVPSLENYWSKGNWLETDRACKQLLDKQGHANSEANRYYGRLLLRAGRVNDALLYLQRATRLDPLEPEVSFYLSVALFNLNRFDEALLEARRGQTIGKLDTLFIIIEFLVALEVNDRPRAAAIIATHFNLDGAYPEATMLKLAEILLMENTEAALSELIEMSKSSEISRHGVMFIAHVASELGDAELAFESFQKSRSEDMFLAIFHPLHRAIRQLPAFKTYVRECGLYEYWQLTGEWADFCRPLGDDDFVCN